MSGKMNNHNDGAGSSRGRETEELIAVINTLPEIRSDKIKFVRDAVESGTYRIDSGKIAERILEEGFLWCGRGNR
jgi:anti-sigma28 factor (negative regulator of flagellin synthesis)